MSYALRAIIEFSSKSNQAKFRTPNAFLTKRECPVPRKSRRTTRHQALGTRISVPGSRSSNVEGKRSQVQCYKFSDGWKAPKWWHKIKFN